MRNKWIMMPLLLLGFAALVALGGFLVQQLWNWLAPAVFGIREVTFWQALGLLALCRILFGGFGSHGRGRGRRQRWQQMSPEEREQFRQRRVERWGQHPTTTEGAGS
jgi:hypothetical protein